MKKLFTKATSLFLAMLLIVSIAAPMAFAEGSVSITYLSNASEGVRIIYSQRDDATLYTIYRKDAENDWAVVGTTSGDDYSYFVDTSVESGVLYTYAIGYTVDSVDSGRTDEESSIYYLAVPKFTVKMKSNKVIVQYSAVNGCDNYQILRKGDGKDWEVIGSSSTGSYIDSTAKLNTTYLYSVRAYKEGSLSYLAGKSISTYPAPSCTNVQTGVKVSYTKVENATLYELYRQNPDGTWVRIMGTYPVSWFYLVDKTAVSGEYYYYSVRAVTPTGIVGEDVEGTYTRYMASPTITFDSTDNGISINISETGGTYAYMIMRKAASESGYKTIGYSTTTNFVDTSAKEGVKYTYAVRAVANDGYISYFNGKSYTLTAE